MEKTYFMCLTGAVFFTVCALVYNGVHGTVTEYLTLPFTSGSFLTSCLYLGIGCTTLAFLLTNRSVTIIGPTRTSAFSGLTTVISVVSGVVFLHEPFSLLQGLATALVLAGQQGCSQADTGHLLLALVQTGITREDAYVIVQRNAMKVWEVLHPIYTARRQAAAEQKEQTV